LNFILKNPLAWLSIAGGELIWKNLRADPVYSHGKAMIGNCRIPGLNGPKCFTQTTDCGGWIEDDFGTFPKMDNLMSLMLMSKV
jgi:hypothetical protein